MVVSLDRGDLLDVYFKQKREVGEWLVVWVLNKIYGYKNVIFLGLFYKLVVFSGGVVYIFFDYVEELLILDGKLFCIFEVVGDDGLFYLVQVVVENGKIKVWSDKVKELEMVCYGWQLFICVNLVNGVGLFVFIFWVEQYIN